MAHRFKSLLLSLLPHHLLSRTVQWSARVQRFPLRQFSTRWFIQNYNVDMSEAIEPDPAAYPDFNSFFTRSLRQEARPVVFVQPVDRRDGRVAQRGQQACLAFEAGQTFGIFREHVRDDLDRDLAAEILVQGFPDLAHAALADLLDQAVVEELLIGFDGRTSGL